MSDFKVDVEAMSSFVQSLSSFEEAAKEYDVEDWVPNLGGCWRILRCGSARTRSRTRGKRHERLA